MVSATISSLVIFNTQQAPPNYRPEVAADRKAP
jgi:hypothetical protein